MKTCAQEFNIYRVFFTARIKIEEPLCGFLDRSLANYLLLEIILMFGILFIHSILYVYIFFLLESIDYKID